MINGAGAWALELDAEELTIDVCTPSGVREAVKLPKGEPTVRVLKEKLAEELSKNSKLMQINIDGDEDALPDNFDLCDGQTVFLLERTPVYSITSLGDAYVLLKQLIKNPRLEWFSQTTSFSIAESLLGAREKDKFHLSMCLNIIIKFFAEEEKRFGLNRSIANFLNTFEGLPPGTDFRLHPEDIYHFVALVIIDSPLCTSEIMDLLHLIRIKDLEKILLVSNLEGLDRLKEFHNRMRTSDSVSDEIDDFTCIMVHGPLEYNSVRDIVAGLNGRGGVFNLNQDADLFLKIINGIFFNERITGASLDRRNYIGDVSGFCFDLLSNNLQYYGHDLLGLLENIVARDDKFSNVIHENLVRFLSVMIEMTVEPRQDLQPGDAISRDYTNNYLGHCGCFIRFQQSVLESRSEHRNKVIDLVLNSMGHARQLGSFSDFVYKAKKSVESGIKCSASSASGGVFRSAGGAAGGNKTNAHGSGSESDEDEASDEFSDEASDESGDEASNGCDTPKCIVS